jgi:hypothetical protein
MELVPVVVTSGTLCLPKPMRGARGAWWLRHPSGGFHQFSARQPGHRPLRCELRLPQGRYTLGVGELRVHVEVRAADVAA